jgi:ATP-dependent DNA helicase RecG
VPDVPPRGGRTLRRLQETPTSALRNVGPRKAAALRSMEIETVLDLLMHYPRRYVDRSHEVPIAEAAVGEEAMVCGRVLRVSTRRPRKGRAMVEILIGDASGTLLCTFFNAPWLAGKVPEGADIAAFGTVNLFRGHLQLVNPEFDVIGDDGTRRTGKVFPVYPQSAKAGIGSTEIGRYMAEVLERAGEFADPLPEHYLARLGYVGRTTAFNDTHAPSEWGRQFPARQRLKFDELLRLQLELVMRKRKAETAAKGISHAVEDGAGAAPGLVRRFLDGLPFRLTSAQRAAMEDIAGDLARSYPMHRLLQGDVGAGKTVVALAAMLYAVQGGYQGALMVPTEVLAEQHFLGSRGLLAGLEVPDPGRLTGMRPLQAVLLTARTTGTERARMREGLEAGTVDIVVGTHALLTEDVRFRDLGVVVIDEQHRFGVEQRAALRDKAGGPEAHDPDVLVMTATPIPRTAAMTVYGDLDLTVLDELPPGRSPIRTMWCAGAEAAAPAWDRVRAEVAAGRQAYVVCALVGGEGAGEAEDDGAGGDGLTPDGHLPGLAGLVEAGPPDRTPPRSAVEEQARLAGEGGDLQGLRVGLLHGQMPSRAKEEVMASFRAHELDVLVATTVIEVGVDVADATVMVVEDADRFGIAQLHQLRGRVGRGAWPSWCYLLTNQATADAEDRLRAMESTTDGFELADIDLGIRGEGTVLGTRQKGRNELRLASIRHDRDLVLAARQVATAIVDEDPELRAHDLLRDELELLIDDEAAEFLFKN